VKLRTARVLSRSRLGFRGAILLCLAIIDVIYGLTLALPSEETRRGSAYAWRAEFLPTEYWGALWILVGIFLVTQAWTVHKRAGYAVAIAIKSLWMVVCVGSWALGPVPASQAFAIGGFACGFALLAFICSLWPEPMRSRTVTTMNDHQGDARG
jgi:hypothetical protein